MRPTGQNCVPVSLNILIINLRSTSTLISILQELTAMEMGQAAFETFVKSRLTKEKTMSIFNPTKKMKLSSFSSMNKTKTCKVYPNIIPVQASKEIFAKISLVAQIQSLNMRSVFNFHLVHFLGHFLNQWEHWKRYLRQCCYINWRVQLNHLERLSGDYEMISDGMAYVQQSQVTDKSVRENLHYRFKSYKLKESMLCLTYTAIYPSKM